MRTLEYVGVEGPEEFEGVKMTSDLEMRTLALDALKLLGVPVPKARKFYPWKK